MRLPVNFWGKPEVFTGRRTGASRRGGISVVGFNDGEFAAYGAPPLVTVGFPSAEMGVAAADMLLDCMETGQTALPGPVMRAMRLALRDSSVAALCQRAGGPAAAYACGAASRSSSSCKASHCSSSSASVLDFSPCSASVASRSARRASE